MSTVFRRDAFLVLINQKKFSMGELLIQFPFRHALSLLADPFRTASSSLSILLFQIYRNFSPN